MMKIQRTSNTVEGDIKEPDNSSERRRKRPKRGITHWRSSPLIILSTLYRCTSVSPIDTFHLRGGAGPGRASCIGGATYSHRQKSSTPLMQIGKSHVFLFVVCWYYWEFFYEIRALLSEIFLIQTI
ncbi:hypothetical protein PUN28_001902 [Cardiocondyla obscurior]|uniref:Uncharacterized protein n=1 Tax=Cardiocondyla obscurior TaxID=286306 RepID=A0AAW2GRT5_9HYME